MGQASHEVPGALVHPGCLDAHEHLVVPRLRAIDHGTKADLLRTSGTYAKAAQRKRSSWPFAGQASRSGPPMEHSTQTVNPSKSVTSRPVRALR